MKYIFVIIFPCIFVLAGCAPNRYIMVPDNVHEISICEILRDSQDYLRKEVIIEGKVLSLSGKSFTLQCLHKPDYKIEVDQSSSITKVETTGRKIRAYGKLLLQNEEVVLVAADIEIGELMDAGSKSGGYQQRNQGGGGGCH